MAALLWTQKSDFGPPGRARHSMAYDAARSRVVLFGGAAQNAMGQPQPFGDTWEWDGESWVQVAHLGPSPRISHAMASDSVRNRIVLFGGITDIGGHAKELGDTWEWDGVSWTQMANGGPKPRTGAAMAFDSTRKKTVLFGGRATGTLFDDTWEWDGFAWTQVQGKGPSPREEHGIAFDEQNGKTLLFGGIDVSQAHLADTWHWDGSTWAEASPLGPPGYPCSITGDKARSRVILLTATPAARNDLEGTCDTWEWEGAHWRQRQDMGPRSRWNCALAYDEVRKRTVLFGGATRYPLSPQHPVSHELGLGDTWELVEQ